MANKKNKAQAKRSAKRAINKSQNHLEKEEFEDDHGITTLETNTEPSMQDYSEAAQFQSGIEGSGPRKLTPILPFNPDSENQGEAAWRNGGKPAMFYQFPRNFDPMTFDDPNSKFNRLHGIALQTKTYITFRKDQDVAIYGTREDTEKAAILIDAWVEEYDLPKLNASAQWAKVHSPTPESQARLHKAIEKEMKRNAWRQPPNVNSKYRFQYRICWTRANWSLEGYLGHNLEALDSIRMDCRCHIVFVRDANPPFFVLLGNDEEKMKRAVQRMQNIDSQVLARRLTPYTFYLVKPFPIDQLRNTIQGFRYSEPIPLERNEKGKEPGITMILSGQLLSKDERAVYNRFVWSLADIEPGTVLIGNHCTLRINAMYANLWTEIILDKLKYFNGFLQMRVRIGTAIFTKYRNSQGDESRLERFKEDLEDRNREDSQLTSHFSEELGNERMESSILARFLAANDIFCAPNTSFFGSFTIPHFHKGPYEYRLEVELKANGTDSDIVMQKWYRLEPNESSFTNVMDINFLDLQRPSSSYNLAITRCHSLLDRDQEQILPGPYRNFANDIKLNCERALDPRVAQRFILFPVSDVNTNVPKIPIKDMQQKRSWRFTVKDSSYVVEVSAIQNIEFSYSPFKVSAREQRWAVQLWHPQWDVTLGENSRLGIGDCATWEAKEWCFFPPRGMDEMRDMEGLAYEKGSGWMELLRVLALVEGVIMGDGLRNLTLELGRVTLRDRKDDAYKDSEDDGSEKEL